MSRTARDLWTPAEDAEIIERYAEGGPAAVLPHVASFRTVDAVVRRASLLKVRRNSPFSHPKGGPVEVMSAVPTHDYTAEDHALRAWRYPVERAQLRAAA